MVSVEGVFAATGAFTGIAALGWNVFRYLKEGPVLRVCITQGIKLVGSERPAEDKFFTLVSVANVGSQATTLTHLIVKRYRGRFDRLLRRNPLSEGIVPHPEPAMLPSKLTIGDEWKGLMQQCDTDEFLSEGGYLYIGVHHTFSDEPKLLRVRPRPTHLTAPAVF